MLYKSIFESPPAQFYKEHTLAILLTVLVSQPEPRKGCLSMNVKDKKDQDFALQGVKHRRLFEDRLARSSCGVALPKQNSLFDPCSSTGNPFGAAFCRNFIFKLLIIIKSCVPKIFYFFLQYK